MPQVLLDVPGTVLTTSCVSSCSFASLMMHSLLVLLVGLQVGEKVQFVRAKEAQELVAKRESIDHKLEVAEARRQYVLSPAVCMSHACLC